MWGWTESQHWTRISSHCAAVECSTWHNWIGGYIHRLSALSSEVSFGRPSKIVESLVRRDDEGFPMRMLRTDNPQVGVPFLVWKSSWFIFLSAGCHDDIATSDADAIRLQVEYIYWLFDIRPNVKRERQRRHLCRWQQFSHEKNIRSACDFWAHWE